MLVVKMKLMFMSVILMLQFLKSVNLQGLVMVSDQNPSDTQTTVSLTEDGDIEASDEDDTDAINHEAISSETLAKVHDVAKNISQSKGIFMSNENKENSDDETEVRRSIRRKISIETESEVMENILNAFESDVNKVATLDQIEYLVHQYDVAVNFAKMGGFAILTPFLFSSDDHIASSVASVLGAAMQSNPTVQELAVKNNVGRNLLKLLSHKSPSVLSRIIFALSSFLRNMPEAQDEFFGTNGISKLVDILKNHQISTNTKLKIVNLLNDLSVELKALQIHPGGPRNISKRERLFPQGMQDYHICKLISSFLNLEDFDTHEKVVGAMISLNSVCFKDFQTEEIRNRVQQLMKLYDPHQDESFPVYPAIDVDLKRDLHGELKTLLKQINQEGVNEDTNETEIRKNEL